MSGAGCYEPVAVSNVGVREDAVYASISGVTTREDAERLRNVYLCVDRAHAAKLPPGRYFVVDLIGCRVCGTDGAEHGVLTDVLETGANDVYVIKGTRTLLIPALKNFWPMWMLPTSASCSMRTYCRRLACLKIDVLTLFPEMFSGVLGASMLGRAQERGILEFGLHNIREYSQSKHKNTDDYPFGGGAGMVMMPQPIFSCLDTVDRDHTALRIVLTPRGETLTTAMARDLARQEHLLLLCGHYEGIDERAMAQMDREVSIGDYVLTGGELPAMVLIDCVSRFIPGVLGSSESAEDESFSAGLLEYPQYTRPAEYQGMAVPEVLLSGNHAHIARWRRQESFRLTLKRRPELMESLDESGLDKHDRRFLAELKNQEN